MRASSQLLPEVGNTSNVVVVLGSDPTVTLCHFTKSKIFCLSF